MITNNKITTSDFFEILLLLMVVVFSTPLLGGSRYIVIISSLAVAFIVANYKYIYIRRNTILVNSIVLYIVVMFGYKFAGISSAEWGNYMNELAFFICMLLMLLIEKKGMLQLRTLTLFAVFGIIAFNIADNIRLSILYPQINTGRIYMDEDLLASINAGGTRFYTFALFFFNVCFFVFLNCKKKTIRYCMLSLAILTGIYICAYCFKASVVLLFFISVVFLCYAKKAKTKQTFFMLFGFTIIVSLVTVIWFEEEIIKFIISVSPDERLTTRFITLIDSENAEANIGTVTGRTNLYLLSVETWLSNVGNFLFGIGDHRAQFGAAATGIGQHGDFFNSLARYGLVGVVLLFLIFKHAFKTILSFFDEKYRLQIICILVVFVFCGFTKGIYFPSIGLIMFLILPLSTQLINRR